MRESLLSPDRVDVAQPSTIMPLCVSLEDAARLLSVSGQHLAKLTKLGAVPSARIGGRIVYRVATLDAWLQLQDAKASPASPEEHRSPEKNPAVAAAS
jgi:hypothetical protein